MSEYITEAKISELKERLKVRFPSDVGEVIAEFVSDALDDFLANEVADAITTATT